jgi:ribonucleoside-diphosphate reductase alpha chain
MKTWEWQQEICSEVFRKKYMLHGEQSIEEVFAGVADEISSPENAGIRAQVRESFYKEMISGRFIPAGRILANARPSSSMKNYNNCFTIDIEDSMESIYDSLKEDAKISKMGGGVGFDISKLRPKNDPLSGGGMSSGAISFLRTFDQSAKTIMTGGQRRSAHIALMDITHPDIEEFISVKKGDSNKELTQFNISVKITDDFIRAVKENKEWNLTFKGKIYKSLPARDLYDRLAENAFLHNEPGIFNTDTVERFNNGHWAFRMDRVNPCGELVMPAYSLCCLGAVNLALMVKDPFTPDAVFDFALFEESVGVGIRFLDNVLDTTDYPLDKIENFSRQWRRIGLGITGLGNAMVMMKINYGSPESLEFAERIGATLRNTSYQTSSDLAGEKGSFAAYDESKFLNANFVQTLPRSIQDSIKRQGIRNIQMNTIAPTGTTSLSVGQNCSSGIEPIFAIEYDRNIRTGKDDETKTERVYDYSWLKYREIHGPDTDVPDYFVTTKNIDPYSSIDLQASLQKYIDHSISKTLNLPPGTTFEEYKNLFMYAYERGLKGFTTFNPEGSMKGILEYRENTIRRRYAPKRPADLPCEIHPVRSGGKEYIIIVGIFNGSLYEVFVITDPEGRLELEGMSRGIVRKASKGKYDLIRKNGKESVVMKDFTRTFDSPDASLARFISMALRHGTPLQFVANQLIKDTNFQDCERSISRVLKKYIKSGEEVITSSGSCEECGAQLVFRDGCIVCQECGFSKCS